jgi:hypothetical protein
MNNEQINQIARAIRLISHGESQPAGLEMLSMAIAGEGCHNSLAGAIQHHAEVTEHAAEQIAGGLYAIAEAIKSTEKNHDN